MVELEEKIKYINKVYQDMIYKRSYSRWIDNECRRETWEESVNRYKEFFLKRLKKNKKEFIEVCESIKKKEVMPSMRALWAAGEALERDNIGGYNCSYLVIDRIKAFSEMIYILMNGAGVGFSVEKRYIEKLPTIPIELKEVDDIIIVSDSKLGWANGYHKLISELYKGKICKYDLSRIRPLGARLKTFGGKASGPEPLKQLFEYTKAIFQKRKGQKLKPIDCHDICCYIANTVVAGGTRRSATISLSDLDDGDLRHAKSGEFWNQNSQRRLANNSAVYNSKPDIVSFLDEWSSLIKSRSGERGIFNRESIKFVVAQTGRRNTDYLFGGNPCQPEWATVLTKNGVRQFKDINIGDKIWSEDGWVSIIRKENSGIKDVYKYRTNAGLFYGTKNHRIISNKEKIEVDKAESIDILRGERKSKFTGDILRDPKIIMDGLVLGDGSVHKASNNLVFLHIEKDDKDYFSSEVKDLIIKHRPGLGNTAYEINTNIIYSELPLTFKREVPDRYKFGDLISRLSFLRGLFSANGSVIESVGRVTLKSSSKKLVEDVQIMLSSVGIKSYITTNNKRKVKFENGEYECKKSWDINIATDIDYFCNIIGFLQEYKNDKLKRILLTKGKSPLSRNNDKTTFDIIEKDYISTEGVYSITVDGEHHTYWTGGCNVSNCLEIILRPLEFCNLSEAIIRNTDTKENILRKVKYATILGCIQSTLTDFSFLGREWKRNTEEERLLGVSLTGLRDHPVLNKVSSETKILLTEMKQTAIDTAEEWSRLLDINMPAAITCVKPSGTVSQLNNCSSGLHTRYSQYYIRRVRISKTDSITDFLIDKKIPYYPEVGENVETTNTFVFEFPMNSPDTSIMSDEVTAIQQLEYWLMLQKYWCEHKPSCTIYVNDDEWLEVGNWVYKNWDYVSGVSFLPTDNNVYQLAPYEEIDEEEYKSLVESFPEEINFEDLSLYETEDRTEGAKEFACVGGSCEI